MPLMISAISMSAPSPTGWHLPRGRCCLMLFSTRLIRASVMLIVSSGSSMLAEPLGCTSHCWPSRNRAAILARLRLSSSASAAIFNRSRASSQISVSVIAANSRSSSVRSGESAMLLMVWPQCARNRPSRGRLCCISEQKVLLAVVDQLNCELLLASCGPTDIQRKCLISAS